MNLVHVQIIMLFVCLEMNYELIANRYSGITMWTGNVYFECTTSSITNCDIELDVFEETNNVVFTFTTFDFKIDF